MAWASGHVQSACIMDGLWDSSRPAWRIFYLEVRVHVYSLSSDKTKLFLHCFFGVIWFLVGKRRYKIVMQGSMVLLDAYGLSNLINSLLKI